MRPNENSSVKIFQRTRMRRGAREAMSAGPAVTTTIRSQGIGDRAASEGIPSGGRVADPLEHVAADVQVEVFHGRVVTALVYPGGDSFLHGLADHPVLPVHH